MQTTDPVAPLLRLEEFADGFDRLTARVEQQLIGKREQVRRALLCLLAGGHLLLDDVPGVGKTTLARALASVIEGGTSSRIQGTPDLLPSDIVGTSIFEPDSRRFTFRHGPIVANIVLFDEINRCAPRTQSALLEAMQERRVTAFRHEEVLPDPFLVIGTQNPQETLGTYPLPEAQLDRFLLRLSLGYPDRDAARDMLKTHGRRDAPTGAGLPVQTLRAMIAFAASVEVADPVYDYLLDIVDTTRQHSEITLGASPRAGVDLLRAARVNALLRWDARNGDRPFLRPDDVRDIAVDVLAHRIVPADRGIRGSGPAQRDLVERIVAKVPVPQTAAGATTVARPRRFG
jgi:MoxR-like ATPase